MIEDNLNFEGLIDEVDIKIYLPNMDNSSLVFQAYRTNFQNPGILSSIFRFFLGNNSVNSNVMFGNLIPATLKIYENEVVVDCKLQGEHRFLVWEWKNIQQILYSNLYYQHHPSTDPKRMVFWEKRHFGFDAGMVPNLILPEKTIIEKILPLSQKEFRFEIWNNGTDIMSSIGVCLTD